MKIYKDTFSQNISKYHFCMIAKIELFYFKDSKKSKVISI